MATLAAPRGREVLAARLPRARGTTVCRALTLVKHLLICPLEQRFVVPWLGHEAGCPTVAWASTNFLQRHIASTRRIWPNMRWSTSQVLCAPRPETRFAAKGVARLRFFSSQRCLWSQRCLRRCGIVRGAAGRVSLAPGSAGRGPVVRSRWTPLAARALAATGRRSKGLTRRSASVVEGELPWPH